MSAVSIPVHPYGVYGFGDVVKSLGKAMQSILGKPYLCGACVIYTLQVKVDCNAKAYKDILYNLCASSCVLHKKNV